MQNFSSEVSANDVLHGLLLDTSWLHPSPQRRTIVRDALTGSPQLSEALVAAARHHKTPTLLARTLGLIGEDPCLTLPEDSHLDEVQHQAIGAREAVLRRTAELESVVEAAYQLDVVPTVLKGAAWEIDLYESLGTRSSTDTDLLIRAYEFPVFDRVLRGLGYVQGQFNWATGAITLTPEERKRSALDSGRHAAPYIRFDPYHHQLFIIELHAPLHDENFHHIDTTPLLHDSVPLPIGSREARQLDPIGSLIYAAAHLNKNLYRYAPSGQPALAYLSWFVDIRQMFLTRPDRSVWTPLYDRAGDLGQTDQVYFAIRHTAELFPDVIPQAVIEPPGTLSKPPEKILDDLWTFSRGSSTFTDRLFCPYEDAKRYLALRAAGEAGGRLSIPRVPTAPPLDGTLDDPAWRALPSERISGAEPAPSWQYFRSHVSYGKIPSSEDAFSATFALCWSEASLYVAFAVCDDQLTFTQQTGFYQEQDCAQLLFEIPQDGGEFINLLLVPAAADLPGAAVVRHYAEPNRVGTVRVPGSVATARITESGYTLTASIPFEELGLAGTGEPFGFDVAVYDSDGLQRRTVLQWSGGRNNLRNPAYFGLAQLTNG